MKRTRWLEFALSATLVACAVTHEPSDLLGPSAASVGGGGHVDTGPAAPSETGGSSGTDGAGGRPRCLFNNADPAPDDAVTTLGDLDQARDALERALTGAGPVRITWNEQIGGSTDLSLELVRWDEHAKVDPSSPGCVLVSGEFHISSADGLIDANISGGFTHDGFEAHIELDADSCDPLPRLCERLGGGPYRGLGLRMSADVTYMELSNDSPDRRIAAGAGLAVPGVELEGNHRDRDDTTAIAPTDPTPPTSPVLPPGPAQPSACTSLELGGSSVLTVFRAGAPPDSGHGGSLVDGIYDLTSLTIYQSTPTSAQYYTRETIRISQQGTYLEMVNEAMSGSFSLAESLAPVGAALNPTTTCPLDAGRSFGPNYTATPGQFSLVNGLYVKTYALRSVP